MPDLPKLTLPGEPPGPPPNLSKFNETTRQLVYSHVYAVAFLEPYLANGGFDSTFPKPKDEAERAELQVFYVFGRWFGAWRNYELNQHLPLEHRWEVVQIKADPDAVDGLMLHEV